jgi:hypothetical protein
MKDFNPNFSNIFIDIDNTLTRDLGKTFIEGSPEAVKKISEKANVFIWSQGGLHYSFEIIKKAKLEPFICGVLPKPDLMIDDLSVEEWCGMVQIQNTNLAGWEKVDALATKLEGNWIEDGFLLRCTKERCIKTSR